MTLAAQDISLTRGANLVLDSVTATFKKGAITAICGPNGAGKSSLLMVLAGLLKPAVGHVQIGADPLLQLPAQARAQKIGYLPQSAEVAWDVAVENLVALGRLPHRDRGHDAIEAAIAALGLEPLRHRPASQLSGGERARALLARVFAGEPDWILADEPLAALDLAHQLSLITHFKAAAQTGQGVVLVLHDLALARNHADHVLVLREGRLASCGAPEVALSSEAIANAWGVETSWIGDERAHALQFK
ncbi:MAG: ABC transporter ATP-binding protein [Erythrobacter sp.]